MIILNANYIDKNGHLVKNATILIENGFISQISTDMATDGHEVIDAANKIVTPGFIDPHTSLGIINQINRFEGNDGNEASGPNLPHMRGLDAIDVSDEGFAMARRGGVTTVITGPGKTNLIGGTYCAFKTGGTNFYERIMEKEIAYHFVLSGEPRAAFGKKGSSPQTRMGSVALIRDMLYKAKAYYENDRSEKKQDFNLSYHSLMRVFDGMLVKFSAVYENDIVSAVRIAKEFDLNYTVDICYDIVEMPEFIKENHIKCVLGPLRPDNDSFEMRNKEPETAALIEKQGIEIAFSTNHPNVCIEVVPIQMILAHKYGMSKDAIYRAVTINAAKAVGLDNSIGSIEPGKAADIVIWDNDPFDYYTNVEIMIIDGKVVEV